VNSVLPYLVSLFFQFDPLVAVSNALASHALYRGLLGSLVVLILTIFLGRFLLRLDLSSGFYSSFFRQVQV
jgi:hypothetical protein